MINKINFQARSIKLTILLNKNFQGTQNIFYSEKKVLYYAKNKHMICNFK